MQMFVDDLYLYFPVGVPPPAMCMSRKPVWTTVGIADMCGYSGQLKARATCDVHAWAAPKHNY